jgi:TonB-dependent starch-binding outer membrane protein SusC
MTKSITKLICTLLCICFSSIAFSQKTVTGTVTSGAGKPVASATVSVKGTKVSATTNEAGTFSINVPAGKSVLTITSAGFEIADVDISGSDNVAVSLTEKEVTLNTVVVTGYSTQRKKDITGAVTVVNVGNLKSVPTTDAGSQLQGRASGVTVVNNGVPGAASTVRIRGLGSFNNNNPLYVIDGVYAGSLIGINPNDIESMQVLKDAASSSIYGVRAANGVIVVTTKKAKKRGLNVNYDMYYGAQVPGKGLDMLNAQEEADLFFLTRKNSGLPTTGSVYGNGPTPVLPDYIYYSGVANNGVPINAGNPGVDPSKYELNYGKLGDAGYSPYIIVPASKGGTNWFKEVTRTAPIQNHNVTMSGATDNARFLLSLNYFDQKAITQYQFYKRFTARLNSEFNLMKGFRIGQNLQAYSSTANTPGAGDNNNNNTEASIIAQTYRPVAIMPVYTIRQGDFAGNLGGPGGSSWGNAKNPLAGAFRNRNNRTNDINLFGNLYAELDITKHITARTSFGGTFNNNISYRYPFIEYEYNENVGNTTYNEGSRNNYAWVWTNQLNYKQSFGKHDVAVLAGTEATEGGGRQIVGSATGFFNYSNINFINLNNGAVQNLGGSVKFTPEATVSYFAKLDYTFSGKYLLSALIRRDGSSKFVDPNKYGNFPAFSLGWRISDEAFMQNIKWVNDLKLRGSWGKTGSDLAATSTNAFTSYSSNRGSSWYDIFGTQNSPQEGFFLSFLGNNLATWEKSTSTNIGFDATIFNGSTEIVFDWYQKKTTDLLFNPEVQAIGGGAASQPFRNVGSMKNSGIDLMINNRQKITKNIVLNSTLTLTTYKNTITGIAPGLTFFNFNSGANEQNRLGQNATRNSVGNPLNTYFGYKVIGIFQSASEVSSSPTQDQAAPGRFKYEDINKDGKIDADDRTVIGNPNPDFTYGLNLSTEYKAFDISAFFYGVAGKDAFNFTRWWTDFSPGGFPGGRSKRALYESWLPDGSRPGATTPIQEVSSGNGFSSHLNVNSYYVEKASYFRLRNLQIGYTLPESLISRVKLSKVRFYVQATNLFTITKYTGMDPDIVSSDDRAAGVDAGAYPTVRQFYIGANVKF